MLLTCDVVICVEEEGRSLGCCRQHESQHGRNIVATWGRREEACSCLDVARNMLAT
jgi:hypothetical protein